MQACAKKKQENEYQAMIKKLRFKPRVHHFQCPQTRNRKNHKPKKKAASEVETAFLNAHRQKLWNE